MTVGNQGFRLTICDSKQIPRSVTSVISHNQMLSHSYSEWTKSISHHELKPWLKPFLHVIYRGNRIIPLAFRTVVRFLDFATIHRAASPNCHGPRRLGDREMFDYHKAPERALARARLCNNRVPLAGFGLQIPPDPSPKMSFLWVFLKLLGEIFLQIHPQNSFLLVSLNLSKGKPRLRGVWLCILQDHRRPLGPTSGITWTFGLAKQAKTLHGCVFFFKCFWLVLKGHQKTNDKLCFLSIRGVVR